VLRIQREDVSDHEVTLVLQGRIGEEWADLLEGECGALKRSGLRVTLDFSGVVFVGRSGFEALSRLSRAGVEIVDCSPLLAAMLEQEGIVAKRASSDAEYR